jgi:hypothetical protein
MVGAKRRRWIICTPKAMAVRKQGGVQVEYWGKRKSEGLEADEER